MAFTTGTRNPAEINVTPLIDVLLVLLIIFMVITPAATFGLNTMLPQSAPGKPQHTEPLQPLVVSVAYREGSTPLYRLNQQPMDLTQLGMHLKEALALRPDHAVFLRADPDLDLQQVTTVIDSMKAASAKEIALLTTKDCNQMAH